MRGIVVFAALTLNGAVAFAQAPPAATETSDARIRCKDMGDKKAETTVSHLLSIADGASVGLSAAAVDALNQSKSEMLGSSHSSRYDAASNRCYIRLYEHKRNGEFETEIHSVYDAQTDDLLAFARRVNGKETGYVFDVHKGPWIPPANCTSCTVGVGWDAAISYMDEIMTGQRN
ncbi:hypothetical protein [Bradyrhizobium canariense]|nr:hypothetical protein [Bradyrhizobium canariense]